MIGFIMLRLPEEMGTQRGFSFTTTRKTRGNRQKLAGKDALNNTPGLRTKGGNI